MLDEADSLIKQMRQQIVRLVDCLEDWQPKNLKAKYIYLSFRSLVFTFKNYG